jgi:hypothetical protein
MYLRGTNINVCGSGSKIVRGTNIDQGLKWYVEQRSKPQKNTIYLKSIQKFSVK